MSNPLKKIGLSAGMLMRDTSGEVLADAGAFERAHSRQLTVNEYTAIKNSNENLRQASEAYLNQSKVHFENSRDLTSRLKPDSAQ